MQVGRAYALGSRSLMTQDILAQAPRQLDAWSQGSGPTLRKYPADIRVTLVEACEAEVKVGVLARLAIEETRIMLPIPRGFDTRRWVQLDGCGKLEPLPTPASVPQEAAIAVAAEPAAEDLSAASESKPAPLPPGAIILRRETGGFAALRVSESWMMQLGRPIEINVFGLCRYVEATGEWKRLPYPMPSKTLLVEPLSPEEARHGDRVLYELPREIGLFWVQWGEREDAERAAPPAARESLATSGPMLCEDLMLGPAPEGQVAACVPFSDRAEARFVPIPRLACRG
jgi:hypothetical protein